MIELPAVPKDLLDALDKRFPERCPEPSWSDREIWMRVGERQVVKFLKRIFDEQNENVMRDTHVLKST
ncbi:TPA: hypothetical protein N2A14_002590 [Pseudomonas aeruginosa]|nr:hypothetical protein [Pseudomonas aeruginosa]